MQAPVQLIDYRIKKLHFDFLNSKEEITKGEADYFIDVDYDIFSYSDDENRFRMDVKVSLKPENYTENGFPFNIDIILEGIFVFDEILEDSQKSYHLNISCTTMLYGAVRSLIHQLTGQTNFGSFTIPAVQFSKIAEKKYSKNVEE